ncbi:MAG: hypothetical protein AAFY71_19280 [Bacteroidota bacterium]
MGIFDFFTGKKQGPGIEAIELDTWDWQEVQKAKNIVVWQNSEFPAQLSVNYFPTAPDLPRPLKDVDHLRDFYRRKLARAKGAILIVEPFQLNGYRAIETLFRIPQKKQEGFIYVGSYTIPFADRSYVVKVQEQEFTHIGERERMIMERLLKDRPKEIGEDGQPIGWEFDPYDPAYEGEFKMNKSEEVRFDLWYPEHPLTHVRQYMYRLKNELKFSDEMKALAELED